MEKNTASFIQQELFNHIFARNADKEVVPILCELLHLNKSSVYNRINGEKLLKLDELVLLAATFGFSIDKHIFPEQGIVPFHFNFLKTPVRNCREYLEQVLASFRLFNSVPGLRVWFLANSLPFFQMMNFRELALFKAFAYARVNWQLPYTENLVFHPDTFPERDVYDRLMRPVLSVYSSIETLEFWPDDLYQTTLKQIKYFQHSGQLTDPQLVKTMLEQLNALCEHQYNMATAGRKWAFDEKDHGFGAKFDLYHNEIAPLNITLLAESKDLKGVFTVYDDPNFMFSDDPTLYNYTLEWMGKLKSKCLHISEDSEQNRRAYFNKIGEEVRNASIII